VGRPAEGADRGAPRERHLQQLLQQLWHDERGHDGADAQALTAAAPQTPGRKQRAKIDGINNMKATLYQFMTSPFCSKVRKILDYKGIDYQIVEVDYVERKELIAASGQIMVPTLRLEDIQSADARAASETIVDSDRIAMRLEELCPEPTILPACTRGLHLALTRYIDSSVEEALFFAAVPDEEEYFAGQGADRLAMFRFIRERKYGAGFCDRMMREHEANMVRVREVLAPFEMALEHGAFLLGGSGLADFALYGQLHFLAFTGVLKIPHDLPRLREFYGRVDRITAVLEETAT
jgi:glutathione S-transferase